MNARGTALASRRPGASLKFLLVSDLHYALKQYDWTAAAGPGFDVVVIAGDHLDIAGQLSGSVQIVVILNYLKRLATRRQGDRIVRQSRSRSARRCRRERSVIG